MLLIDAGFPKPTTQIPVYDGWELIGVLDWGHLPLAGDTKTNRRQYVKDMRRIPKIERNCWIDIRVIAEDRDDDVIDRVYRAMVSRGWKP